MNRTVTLTNARGEDLGPMDIVEAHKDPGHLHKAFSVYIFSPDHSQLLIQQRSAQKMLWPSIWANTCCSHPFPDEDAITAGKRRLKEELGIEAQLREGPAFVYHAVDPKGYGVEHERDVLLLGTLEPERRVTPNPDEVAEYKWIQIDDLLAEMTEHPLMYAPWLHLGLPLAMDN